VSGSVFKVIYAVEEVRARDAENLPFPPLVGGKPCLNGTARYAFIAYDRNIGVLSSSTFRMKLRI